MPADLFTSHFFSIRRPEKSPCCLLIGSLTSCDSEPIIGKSGHLVHKVERLLTIAFAAIIFFALPTHESKAEMNLQGMQFPSARTASFDRKESVLDRFRSFTGEKTQTAFESLFMRWDTVFRQEPAVILSDGKSVVRVTLRLQGRAGDPPNLSLHDGHCVSAKMTDAGIWILEILPNRGSISTSLTVAFAGQMTEYPLTVAPPMDLFDPRNADTSVINYVTTANHLASLGTNPAGKR